MRVLNHFSLENFRLFKEKTSFDLAPITVLTGTNSSGKSSLIKAILLLKANFEKNKSIEEIDFSVGNHKLNDFKNSLNYDSESDTMYFSFSSYVEYMGVRLIELGYKLTGKDDNKGLLNSFSISTSDGELIFSAFRDFDDEIGGNITYRIDIKYFIKNLDDEVLNVNIKKRIYDDPYEDWVQKYWLTNRDELFNLNPESDENKIYLEALEELKTSGLKMETGWNKNEMRFFNQSIVDGLRTVGREVISWLELNFKHHGFQLNRTDYGNFFYEDFSEHVLKSSVNQIFYNFEAISHFSSLRSDSKKYYTKEDKGLFSLFTQYEKVNAVFNSEIKEFVKSQLQAFAFGDTIEVANHKNILTEVYLVRSEGKVLLSDLGFGYTQLLPIIMKIALVAHLGEKDKRFFLPPLFDDVLEPTYWDSFFLLEEPESNLHPAFQSKIAELIAYAAAKFRIRFIVETHSEYLIRKLQYLIAKRDLINSDAVTIYYFNKPGSEEAEDSLFRTIQIEPNGRLTGGFGSGFFDESDNIAFDLFMLNHERQN
ncbi:DUF3696 domain-containing protein [Algoriphagus limi]|uniref:DUF3696 domain-containing protein n=1 Tax=Algoriphagus limi TaxID=2975273 RepID=A0ABT2G0T6_9BACT|nr:DUF3696 domain-containing protein [Algoriphagus limi]MCS5488882.1 DUF3696 domain-containing protein [Algoriphagus limi]